MHVYHQLTQPTRSCMLLTGEVILHLNLVDLNWLGALIRYSSPPYDSTGQGVVGPETSLTHVALQHTAKCKTHPHAHTSSPYNKHSSSCGRMLAHAVTDGDLISPSTARRPLPQSSKRHVRQVTGISTTLLDGDCLWPKHTSMASIVDL